jgi:hypothetical protein
MDETKLLIQILRDVGFPVAVAAYVLVRLEHLLRQIRDDQRDFLGLLGGRLRRQQRAK